MQQIRSCASTSNKIKVGLEATGHYSYNILGFLLDNGLPTFIEKASAFVKLKLTVWMQE